MHGREAAGSKTEDQTFWVRSLLRDQGQPTFPPLGSLPITIEDVNDNAPYFLPENKTFGKQQAPPSPPTLYSARTTFGQLPQMLLRPQLCP